MTVCSASASEGGGGGGQTQHSVRSGGSQPQRRDRAHRGAFLSRSHPHAYRVTRPTVTCSFDADRAHRPQPLKLNPSPSRPRTCETCRSCVRIIVVHTAQRHRWPERRDVLVDQRAQGQWHSPHIVTHRLDCEWTGPPPSLTKQDPSRAPSSRRHDKCGNAALSMEPWTSAVGVDSAIAAHGGTSEKTPSPAQPHDGNS